MSKYAKFKGGNVCSLNIRNVPVDVRAQFRAYCLKRDISMQDAIIKFMRDIVK